MHGGVVALIVIIIVVVLYLIMAGGPDKIFIANVATAKAACAAAVASQAETDYSAAIAAISAAKTSRSTSLAQYAPLMAAGPPIPPEVNQASIELDSLSCSQHNAEKDLTALMATATAACAAMRSNPSKDNVNTATNTYSAALAGLKLVDPAKVTQASLKAAIAAFMKLDCSLPVASGPAPVPTLTTPSSTIGGAVSGATGVGSGLSGASTFNITGKIGADNHAKIYVNNVAVSSTNVNDDWLNASSFTINGLKDGDQVDFEITNDSGPAGFIATWTSSAGNIYRTNLATVSCVTPGYTAVVATFGWWTTFVDSQAQWIWTDNTNNTPAGTVRRFRWIARN